MEERQGLGSHGSAGLVIADETTPVLGKLLAKLRNPAVANLELAGSGSGRFALCEEFGYAAVTALERSEPVVEVDADASDVGGSGVLVFDEDFAPLPIVVLVAAVEPIDLHVLLRFAVR